MPPQEGSTRVRDWNAHTRITWSVFFLQDDCMPDVASISSISDILHCQDPEGVQPRVFRPQPPDLAATLYAAQCRFARILWVAMPGQHDGHPGSPEIFEVTTAPKRPTVEGPPMHPAQLRNCVFRLLLGFIEVNCSSRQGLGILAFGRDHGLQPSRKCVRYIALDRAVAHEVARDAGQVTRRTMRVWN